MKIEQINLNKIQITLSKDDLENNKIDLFSIMSNSSTAQTLFLSILNLAEKEFGFETNSYNVVIETLLINNNEFIFTISRQKNDLNSLHKYLSVHRFKNSFVYQFNNFNDFYEFYSIVKFKGIFKKSLFYFNNRFYFLFNKSLNDYKYLITEYASPSKTPLSLIKEYGKQVL